MPTLRPTTALDEDTRVKKNSSLYGPAFYTGMAVLFLALFVLNACTHGTLLGLISTGGLAAVMGYIAYRAWSRKRHINSQ
jgi:FtsH-binding integral membrane protein